MGTKVLAIRAYLAVALPMKMLMSAQMRTSRITMTGFGRLAALSILPPLMAMIVPSLLSLNAVLNQEAASIVTK